MPLVSLTPYKSPFPALTLTGLYSLPVGYVSMSGSVGGLVIGASTVTGYVTVSGGV